MESKTVIPEKYVSFCEQVARLAKEAGLRSVGMNFTPGFEAEELQRRYSTVTGFEF